MKNKLLFCFLLLSVLILTTSRGWAGDDFPDTTNTFNTLKTELSATNPPALPTPQPPPEEEDEDDEADLSNMQAMTAAMMADYLDEDDTERENAAGYLQEGRWDLALNQLENAWEEDLQNYYGDAPLARSVSLQQTQQTLASLEQASGRKSAIVYLASRQNSLEVLLVTADAPPARHNIQETNRDKLFKTAGQLLVRIDNKGRTVGRSYLAPAKELYEWIMAPIVPQLDRQKITNLVFVSDYGLRSVPMGVLYDGQHFLIEKYSISNSPNFSMIDSKFKSIRNSPVLAMGASTFTNQNPLPAVPLELRLITQDLGTGQSFLNQPFTMNNLLSQRQQQPYEIIHLATHADFNAGSPDRSYIQFFDSQLLLSDITKLRLNDPPVQLLVISACQSAVGNKTAELGFAGLAVRSGVDTVVASLWYVSDEGTLALMSEFYRYLRTAPIKAEALQQAQIAMIKGNIRIEQGQLIINQTPNQIKIALPPELANLNLNNLSHPYYWSAFTMIGSPW
jgi:CHAT domain-containing protein